MIFFDKNNTGKFIMKIAKKSLKVDVSNWDLDSLDTLKNKIEKYALKMAGEALTIALEEGVSSFFPHEWAANKSDGIGGKPPRESTTIYISIPLTSDEHSPTYWQVSLKDAVDSVISLHEDVSTPGKITDEDSKKCVAKIRDGLVLLSKKLTKALGEK